jgi:hypothetical protein
MKAKIFFCLNTLLLVALIAPQMVAGQDPSTGNQKAPPSLAGKYDGLAKGPSGDVQMTLELIDSAGKFSGQITTPRAVYKIVKGVMSADGLLTLDVEGNGTTGKLTLRQKDGMLVGELSAEGRNGPIEFRKAAKDEISGEWDAAADAQGQPFPFTLSLKLDGEKVTGSSSSQLGHSTISSGVWKEGKLTIVLDGANGAIGLIAILMDGKLVGDYDYAGQLQGKWVAVKKK